MERSHTGPRLIIVCGLPGSGKSTHAKLLEARLGAIRFSPDEWMDALSLDPYDEERRWDFDPPWTRTMNPARQSAPENGQVPQLSMTCRIQCSCQRCKTLVKVFARKPFSAHEDTYRLLAAQAPRLSSRTRTGASTRSGISRRGRA